MSHHHPSSTLRLRSSTFAALTLTLGINIVPKFSSSKISKSMAFVATGESSAVALLFEAAAMVPIAHYIAAAVVFVVVFFYNLLEIHVIGDIVAGLRGDCVELTFNPASEIYEKIVAKSRTLRGRYFPTLWLSSPHLQTAFLNYYGRAPVVNYRRQLFSLSDGGTLALDWFLASDVTGGSNISRVLSRDETTPLVVLVPGLTSDSAAAYMKHCVYVMAKQGWNAVVSNHRGLGGVAVTSDCFYNAGWTDDVREVVNYLHREYPEAPLFAVAMSIGANILVKYLGEDGENTPIAGAASVCSPYDLLICDRYINRKPIQRFYDRVLTTGLRGYAKFHESTFTRIANWDGITKSRSLRDFDNHATCHFAKYETVDTYYRSSSSVPLIGNIAVPLLCISALDDPVCTKESIPWDECRKNKNIVLATTAHGGHLAYFQGLTASSLWWVQAVREFLSILDSSPFMHVQKKTETCGLHSSLASSIDKGPYINIMEDGMVATANENAKDYMKEDLRDNVTHDKKTDNEVHLVKENENKAAEHDMIHQNPDSPRDSGNTLQNSIKAVHEITTPIKRSLNQLSRHYGKSMWLLAYIAIVTSWPLLGSALSFLFSRKLKSIFPASKLKR